MNKKKLSLIIICVCVALVLVVSIILATAGGSAETPETTTSPEASEAATTGENNAQDSTAPGETTAPGEATEPAAAAAATTPDEEEETQPATIPPENVQMGVVEGADDGGLDSNIEDTPDQPTQPTRPNPGTEPPAVQEEGLPEDFDITTLTYESYNAMNGTQQRQAIAMFASPEEFMKWYKAVEAQYLAEHPEIEIGEDGTIDAGSIGK